MGTAWKSLQFSAEAKAKIRCVKMRNQRTRRYTRVCYLQGQTRKIARILLQQGNRSFACQRQLRSTRVSPSHTNGRDHEERSTYELLIAFGNELLLFVDACVRECDKCSASGRFQQVGSHRRKGNDAVGNATE